MLFNIFCHHFSNENIEYVKNENYQKINNELKKYDEDFCFPCGACLQVMSEFCDDDFEVILCKEGKIKVFKFCELMPNVFSSEF